MTHIHAITQELQEKFDINHQTSQGPHSKVHTLKISKIGQTTTYPKLTIYCHENNPHILTLRRTPSQLHILQQINLTNPNSIEQLEQEIQKALQQ